MQIIDNKRIKEKIFVEKLDNGLTIMVVPKNTRKKYIEWSVNFGSIDNKFYAPGEDALTVVPDGIAHYLEHKMFEQENKRNSLDTLTAMGVEANAYTTNDHTSYLFECTENFDEALDEFMDYVQHPYFTDENVEKERGIIEQEIMMYDDYPEWSIYMNAMRAMYHKNEINIDVAGTVETIAGIDKDKLYRIYNSFYRPENMMIVLSGDFIPEEILEKVKSKVIMPKDDNRVRRVYNEESDSIVKPRVEKDMDISMPMVLIAFKDNELESDFVKKDIANDIISSAIFAKSTDLFKSMYEEGKLFNEPSITYEFSKGYAHMMIQYQSNYPEEVLKIIEDAIEDKKKTGISDDDFERAKRGVYGSLVKDYNDVSTIASGIIADYFRDISPFEYFEKFDEVTKEYVEEVLNKLWVKDREVVSVINPIEEEDE